MEFLGLQITRKKSEIKEEENLVSFTQPEDSDGAIQLDDGINTAFAYDFDVAYTNDKDLIKQYRALAEDADVDWAIDEIINEVISFEPNKEAVSIDLSKIEFSETIKNKIREEFEEVMALLDFDNKGDEIFRSWYIDGRIFFHKIIDKSKVKEGIKEVRRIDPIKIKKVREDKKKVENGIEVFHKGDEYYIYMERNDDPKASTKAKSNQTVKIPADAITYVHSGLFDPEENTIRSYLHKALKPFNQLSQMETATVIYKIARAPERRIFYVDVGNLPKTKAEQYMRNIMSNYKNKMVYDARSGKMKDNRNHMSMLEDIWLPRREGSRGTQVETTSSGQNLGEMDEVIYFKKKLMRSLHVPVSRQEQDTQISLGRSNEITRDEVKFTKFVGKLRKKFSLVFKDILKTQLILKNIITLEDWEEIKNDVEFEFNSDQYFSELKDAEIMTERVQQIQLVNDYIGRFFSLKYVRENILRMTEDEQKEMDKQIEQEIADGKLPDPNKQPEDEGNY